MENLSGLAAVGGLLLALIVNAIGVFRHIATVKEGLLEKIQSGERLCADRIESARTESRLLVEKLAESESKSRHDLANMMQAAIGEQRRDIKAIEMTVGTVQRDMITRTDINDLKQEIKGEFDRNDRARTDMMDRFEKRLTDTLARRGE